MFDIDRKQKRSLGRALSRNGIKLTLWLHKALWKDSAYGTAVFKTEDLETKSEVSFIYPYHSMKKNGYLCNLPQLQTPVSYTHLTVPTNREV